MDEVNSVATARTEDHNN